MDTGRAEDIAGAEGVSDAHPLYPIWTLADLRPACPKVCLKCSETQPQVVVVGLLLRWERPVEAPIIVVFLTGQILMMLHFLKAPTERAIWYSGFGVPLFVFGMLASAFAVRGVVA